MKLKVKKLINYLLIPLTAYDGQAFIAELKRLEWIFVGIRWLWVPVILVLAWMHHPISRDVMIASSVIIAVCNIFVCLFNIKIKKLRLQRLLGVAMLTIDMVIAWSVIFLFVNDFYTAAYASFAYVIIEGSMRFGLIGSTSTMLSFTLGLYAAYMFRDWQYGIRFSTSGFVYWNTLMLIIATSMGIAVNEWKRQQWQKEHFIKEKVLISERHRIARDLHDTVLKTLQGLIFEARGLAKSTSHASTKETAQYIEEVCSQTSKEIRELIFDLRIEGVGAIGLATQKLLEEWSNKTGIEGEFRLLGQDKELNNRIIMNISAIVSEALINIKNHARASHVYITIKISEGDLSLEIKDDGCGIKDSLDELYKYVDQGKLGIASIKERTESLGGSFTINSDSNGTLLYLQIPI